MAVRQIVEAMKTWHDPYIRVEVDAKRRLVRQTRSARGYEDVETLRKSIAAAVAQMASVDRAEYALLQDMRAPKGRNDPEFEAALAAVRPTLSTGFRRIAILVATNVGRLQVQRYLDKDKSPARAYLDEQTALRWLEQD
ncbi:MAG TPA: hypothetical protein VJV78_17145 [Polyangiales bacterium]|nr:hypothetical protein [Polyangiales bacterium]